MGFLDNLKGKAEEFGEKAKEGFEAAKDKASDLMGDVKDRLDKDDATLADKVGAAPDHSPEGVNEVSRGLDEAVAEAPAADVFATETAADEVGDVGNAPATDPLEPGDRVADAVDGPADTAPGGVIEDPLESRVEAVDPIVEPVESAPVDDDPLEATPDRTA
jgi:hypothetical protein